MRRSLIAGLALALTLWVGFGGTRVGAAETEVLAVGNASLTQIPYFNIGPFAKKYGINVVMRRMGTYTQMQQAVELGAADFAAIGYVNLVLMAAAGGSPKAQAVSGIFVGGQDVVFHKDVKIAKWKDVEGKTIGRLPGSFAEFLFRVAAAHNGADVSKIKFKDFGFSFATLNFALKNREIDGLVIWSPGMEMPVVEGFAYFAPISVQDTPVGDINGLLGVNTGFMKKNPEVVEKVVKAFAEATQHFASNPEEWVKRGRELLGTDVRVLQEGIKHSKLTNMIYAEKAKTLAKVAHEGKIVKKDASKDIVKWINYDFLMKATGKGRKDLGG